MYHVLGSLVMLAICLTLVPGPPVVAQFGDNNSLPALTDPVEIAVQNGLDYLKNQQNSDGSWSASIMTMNTFPGRRFPTPNAIAAGDSAITALAIMAFLSAGFVPEEGPHEGTLRSAIQFVLKQQSKSGLFSAQTQANWDMYYHGICTLMLAEVLGMVSGDLGQEIRDRLQSAIQVILVAQRSRGADTGGWRYQVQGTDADLSVTGWQLLALRAARNVGSDIPEKPIQEAVQYVQRCFDGRSGGYRYTTTGNVTVPCTGVGILSQELCGKDFHQSEQSLQAAAFLLRNPMSPRRQHFFYGIYYTAQAMFQIGDNSWPIYRVELHDALLKQNPPNQRGAWEGSGFDDLRFGSNYCTAMAILALTVEYRYLPIYQRMEEPKERE